MSEQFEKLREKVAAFIEQAEFCGYECIAGPLKNNIAFVRLKEALAERTNDDAFEMIDKRCVLCKHWQGDINAISAICDEPEFVQLVRLDDGTFKSIKPIHESYRDSQCSNFEQQVPKEILDAFAAAIREEIALSN